MLETQKRIRFVFSWLEANGFKICARYAFASGRLKTQSVAGGDARREEAIVERTTMFVDAVSLYVRRFD